MMIPIAASTNALIAFFTSSLPIVGETVLTPGS